MNSVGLGVLITVVSFILFLIFIYSIFLYLNNKDTRRLNEDSFQRYAKFYGEVVPSDNDFKIKLNKIYHLIVDKNVFDINEISLKSSSNITQSILIIRYLKNKRLIGNYYIDVVNNKLVPCSLEDQKLIEKYSPYVYNSHLQINEIATVIANPSRLSVDELCDSIYKDLVYLNNKGLLNGLKINDVDRSIIYYSVEKKKIYYDVVSVHCPNCGALNDVQKDGKCRCEYCKNIIEGKDFIE